MKIEELDKNLKIESKITKQNITWYDAAKAPFKIYGVKQYDGKFLRMPEEVSQNVSANVVKLCECTAGGRVRFCTDSDFIAIKVETTNRGGMAHMPRTGQSSFDIYFDKTYYRSLISPVIAGDGYETFKEIPSERKMRLVTLNFPLYDEVDRLYIALSDDAKVTSAPEYTYSKPIVFYGSSITQGGCASRPGNAYTSMIARKLDADHINLGFSGNAKGETAMAEYIADLDMSVFVMDYDHNAPDTEHLEKTHYPFYKIIRDKNPDLPIVMVSSPPSPQPCDRDFEGRKRAIEATYERAIKEGDTNVYFIDGMTMFDGEFADCCTVDGCHPNDLGFYRMAISIGAVVEKVIK